MKLIGYIRVNYHKELDNHWAAPRQRLEAYCLEFFHELVAVFEEIDRGENQAERPELEAALEMLHYQADGLIALNLDHLARTKNDLIKVIENTLEKAHKCLVLIEQQMDTSQPQGAVILKVMAAVASLGNNLQQEEPHNPVQFNSWENSDRPTSQLQKNMTYPPCTQSLLGDNANKCLENQRHEEAAIAVIWQQHQAGKSLRAIASYLNLNGYSAYKSQRWNYQRVQTVLYRLYQQQKFS